MTITILPRKVGKPTMRVTVEKNGAFVAAFEYLKSPSMKDIDESMLALNLPSGEYVLGTCKRDDEAKRWIPVDDSKCCIRFDRGDK